MEARVLPKASQAPLFDQGLQYLAIDGPGVNTFAQIVQGLEFAAFLPRLEDAGHGGFRQRP